MTNDEAWHSMPQHCFQSPPSCSLDSPLCSLATEFHFCFFFLVSPLLQTRWVIFGFNRVLAGSCCCVLAAIDSALACFRCIILKSWS
ncbi:hypothetical protein ACSBR2_040883 [Camellia fascicularis]